MRTTVLISALVCLCLMGFSPEAFSADVDVCPVCTYTSIQTAIDAANPGDRVRIASGTYNEGLGAWKGIILSGGWNNSFSNQNIDPSATVVDAGGLTRALAINPAPNPSMTVENMTFRNGATNAIGQWGAGIYVIAWDDLAVTLNNIVVEDCHSLQAPGGGIELDVYGANLTAGLTNVISRRNQASNLGGGMVIVSNDDSGTPGHAYVYLTNCLFYSNSATGQGGGAWLYAQNTSTLLAVFVNCTLTDNTTTEETLGGGGICVENDAAPTQVVAEIYNSIVYGNAAPPGVPGKDLTVSLVGPLSRTDAYFSDLGQVDVKAGTYNTGSVLNADPKFKDAPGHNYHLRVDSPLRNRGTPAVPNPPGLPATDLDRRPRAAGSAPDMGAYEIPGAGQGWMFLLLD